MSGDQSLRLDYSEPPHWLHRRGTLRIILTGSATAVLLSAFYWFPPLYSRAVILYWQREVMQVDSPPQQIAYTDAANQLTPDNATLLFGGGRVVVGRPDKSWEKFCGSANFSAGFAPLYLHQRQSRAGGHRLVVIEVGARPGITQVLTRTIQPGSFARPPVQLWQNVLAFPQFSAGVTLWAGQSDPADAAHFTIAAQLQSGQRLMLDGWLRDDDSIALDLRPMNADHDPTRPDSRRSQNREGDASVQSATLPVASIPGRSKRA